jgi:hypothetical protein
MNHAGAAAQSDLQSDCPEYKHLQCDNKEKTDYKYNFRMFLKTQRTQSLKSFSPMTWRLQEKAKAFSQRLRSPAAGLCAAPLGASHHLKIL